MIKPSILITICGLKRCIDLVIENIEKIFHNYDIYFILCLSNDNNNDNYYYNIDNSLLNNKNIIKYILLKDQYDNSYRNSLNYSYKLYNSIKLIENNYDYYMILRSDMIIDNINIDRIDNDRLYFSNKNINQFTKDIQFKINDNIIISKDYYLISKLIDLHIYNIQNKNYLDINLYNFIEEYKLKYTYIDIKYKLILSKCNIIAIAGDSGSGKSTLLKAISPLFNDECILRLETDRYHKWERGDKNYNEYTHLNPYANHLEKMYDDVYNLKIGNNIYQVDYDHNNGKFTQKQEINSKENIIICGLHTLYDRKMKELVDIKIFIDTDRDLLKKWKIQRDVIERGYTMEKVLTQIHIREKDYYDFIITQKDNSDIIINFYNKNDMNDIIINNEKNKEDNIGCRFIIKNKKIIDKLLTELIKLKYTISFIDNDNSIIFDLKNIYNHFEYSEYIENNKNLFQNNYYIEIYNLLYLYLYV